MSIDKTVQSLPVIEGAWKGGQFAYISAVLRNYGAPDYWQVLDYTLPYDQRAHKSNGIDSVVTNADGTVTINYASIGATAIGSLNVSPDNDMVKQAGTMVGASVTQTQAILNFAQPTVMSDFVSYDGTNWVFVKGANSPFAFLDYTAGVLNLSHTDTDGFSGNSPGVALTSDSGVSVTPRGHAYDVVVSSASGAAGRTNIKLEFWDTATNVLAVAATTNMKVFLSRGLGINIIDAHLTGLATLGENVWVNGIFPISTNPA